MRLSNILKHLFPVPKDDSKRVVTFAQDNDYISFRHHTYTAPRGAKSIELKEVRVCVDMSVAFEGCICSNAFQGTSSNAEDA